MITVKKMETIRESNSDDMLGESDKSADLLDSITNDYIYTIPAK